MADNEQARRTELHDAGPRREGHGAGEVRRRLPGRGHAVREAAAQPDAARASREHRHERGAGDARREGDPDGGRPARRRGRRQTLGESVTASAQSERGLTDEPLYEGEPILAVAAVDELTAAEAIEKIQIEYEPLPFAVDPIASLRPGSANARTQGQRLDAARSRPAAPRRDAARRSRRRPRQGAPRTRRAGCAGDGGRCLRICAQARGPRRGDSPRRRHAEGRGGDAAARGAAPEGRGAAAPKRRGARCRRPWRGRSGGAGAAAARRSRS